MVENQWGARPEGFTAVILNICRPRNFFLGPIALFAIVSTLQLAFGIEKGTNSEKASMLATDNNVLSGGGRNRVQAWLNPNTGKYETPAPWDPVYRKLQPELEMIPRDQVTSRSQ